MLAYVKHKGVWTFTRLVAFDHRTALHLYFSLCNCVHPEKHFFVIKPIRCSNFTNLFCQDQDGTAAPSWSCSTAVYKPVWPIPLLSVQWINSWWWTDELSETCRVSWQNKFVKLVHLVGFIIKKLIRNTLSNLEHKDFGLYSHSSELLSIAF